MKKEAWDYISNNWASTDESTMARVAELRAEADAEARKKQEEIDNHLNRIRDLEKSNQDLTNTNMTLFLRMTNPDDPLFNGADPGGGTYEAPDLDDYDAFLK